MRKEPGLQGRAWVGGESAGEGPEDQRATGEADRLLGKTGGSREGLG